MCYKFIYLTRPKKLPENFDTDEFRKRYKTAVCKCNVDSSYGLIIPREYEYFECSECGLSGSIL